MLRFAFGPTGDMTLDALRDALLNYLTARHRGERFVVRIEDGDADRNVEGKDREGLDILSLCGVQFDDVTYESRNLTIHQHMAIKLLQERKAFACFCTPETLEARRASAVEAGRTPRYDGGCDRLRDAEVIDNPNPFTIRLKAPETPVEIDDSVAGTLRFAPEEIDSFVIMEVDKRPTPDFATAVEDMLQDVTTLYTGRDPRHSARQSVVREALGYERGIRYGHLPPILPPEEGPMPTVPRLLREGYLPEAIADFLLRTCLPLPEEALSLSGIAAHFDPEKISGEPVRFDRDTLNRRNREHIRLADAKELSRAFGFADADVGELAKRFADTGACTLEEIRPHIRAIFSPKPFDGPQGERMRLLKAALADAPLFEDFGALAAHLSQKTGLQGEALETPLRLLLTGEESGPALSALYPHLKNYLQEIVK